MTIDEEVLFLSKKAVFYDKHGNVDAALYFYKEAIDILRNMNHQTKIFNAFSKISEYERRIRELEEHEAKVKASFSNKSLADTNQLWLDRMNFMLQEALNLDEAQCHKEALDMYLEAADMCMKNKKNCEKSLEIRLTKLASQSIERAEMIKDNINKTYNNSTSQMEDFNRIFNDLDNLIIGDEDDNEDSCFEEELPNLIELTSSSKRRHSCYSESELNVLRHTSIINGIKYPPFLEGFDDRKLTNHHQNNIVPGERFSFVAKPFVDPDGLVRLAPKQIAHFQDWCRPSAISFPSNPLLFPPPLIVRPQSAGKISTALERTSYYPPLDWAAIRQTIISDCSFVASLTVCAHHEARFFSHRQYNSLPNKGIKRRYRPLISNLIYPRDRAGLRSIYNPCGKYVVKLLLNGVPRKVVVDDKLPTDKYKFPLCSYIAGNASQTKPNVLEGRIIQPSTNGFCINEFWVSIMEKAYVKVMGGYDFPGSNSNIDLHALTGWIPERVPIVKSKLTEEVNYPYEDAYSLGDTMTEDENRLFDKLFKKFHEGDLLITLATGPLTDSESERTGLVSTHAYALIDIRHVAGFKLFRLKNPWSHMRWKGNFSERDRKHWEDPILGPQLKKALSYDITKYATMESPIYLTSSSKSNGRNSPDEDVNDDGLFWIDYKSIRQFFEVFYLNWDPLLFPYTTCRHDKWEPYQRGAVNMPIKDAYVLCYNPQYKLTVFSPNQTITNSAIANSSSTPVSTAAVWILLSRHIVDKEDFASNKEFITVLVYEGGEKIYYPYEPAPLIDGVRINSPHYLCKMIVNFNEPLRTNLCPQKQYTLVISEYEKINTIFYTLRVYSTVDFALEKIEDPYKFTKEFIHSWKGISAGGCTNNPDTYYLNPCYKLQFLANVKKPGSSNQSKTNLLKFPPPPNFDDQQLLIMLKAPKEYCVGIDIYSYDNEHNRRKDKLTSGPFRSGFSILKCDLKTWGEDTQNIDIIPSTFMPGQEGPFILTIMSTREFQVELAKP